MCAEFFKKNIMTMTFEVIIVEVEYKTLIVKWLKRPRKFVKTLIQSEFFKNYTKRRVITKYHKYVETKKAHPS